MAEHHTVGVLLYAVAAEFSQATASCCDLLEVAAARARVRASFEPAATVWGSQASLISGKGQQQAVQLCPATVQGLKHWRQVQAAAGEELWEDLWGSNAAKLEEFISKAFAAGFGAHLEQSTLQHYVGGCHRLLRVAAAGTGQLAASLPQQPSLEVLLDSHMQPGVQVGSVRSTINWN